MNCIKYLLIDWNMIKVTSKFHILPMVFRTTAILLMRWLFFSLPNLSADARIENSTPFYTLSNPNPTQSLVNSAEFHPKENLFCITYTHNHQVALYAIDGGERVVWLQTLNAQLNHPAYALFSKDGKTIVVSNWTNETFTLYHADAKGFYGTNPQVIAPLDILRGYKPHGAAFSPDGNYLAVAYGATVEDPRGIALYHVENLDSPSASFTLTSLLQTREIQEGIPKGIAFTPDGRAIAVTLAHANAVALYSIDWEQEVILAPMRQLLSGDETGISRPEDIKFTPNGSAFAVSNSDKDSVTFYAFDRENNRFLQRAPMCILDNPQAKLCFPHGLAFSSDGKYLCVTQFGPMHFGPAGGLISWAKERGDSFALFHLPYAP